MRNDAQIAVLVFFRRCEPGADAGEIDIALGIRRHAFRMAVNGNGVFFQGGQWFGGFRLFFCWRCGQRAARQAEKEWCRFHGVVRYRSLDPYDMGAMEMQAL